MKHAYLYMAHKYDKTLDYSLRLVDDRRNDIFIHVDAKCKNFPFESVKEIVKKSCLYFTERIKVTWGGYSQICTEYILLKSAVKNGGYSYYHLMSGQDLPLKNQDEIHNFFDSNSGKEFVRFYDEDFHDESRVQYHWFAQDAIGRGNKPYTYLVKTIMKAFIGVEKALKVKRHSDVEFQKGSNWFSITDDLANYVLSKEEWVHSIFRNTYCCDEVFLQTIIFNSQYRDRLYWTKFDNDMHAIMRLIIWEGTGPKVFTMGDKELIEKCDYLFGRKFDWNVDSEIVQFVYRESKLK